MPRKEQRRPLDAAVLNDDVTDTTCSMDSPTASHLPLVQPESSPLSVPDLHIRDDRIKNTSLCSSTGISSILETSLSTVAATNVTHPSVLACLSLLSSSSSPGHPTQTTASQRVIQSVQRHLEFHRLFWEQPVDQSLPKHLKLGRQTLQSLASGDVKRALQSSQRAVKQARQDQRPLPAALGMLWRGLCQAAAAETETDGVENATAADTVTTATATTSSSLLLGSNHSRTNKPLDSWREATQLACVGVGYEDWHTAVLLNNIGVWHAEREDPTSALAALQEAHALQTTLMAKQQRNNVEQLETGLFLLATTMTNLALVEKRPEVLLEARTILSSLENVSPTLLQLMDQEMYRLAEGELALGTADRHTNVEDDEASVATADSLESIRSSSLFGNSDGIPIRAAERLSHQIVLTEDFIVLGPLHPSWSGPERIHRTVQTWLDGLDDENDQHGDSSWEQQHNKQAIPVDLDEQLVPNAELRLAAIHLQILWHLQRNQCTDALDLIDSTLKSHITKYGPIHHLVGSAWHKRGLVHMYAHDYTLAQMAFLKAAKIRSQALGAQHPDVQATQLKLVLVYMAQQDFDAALQLLHDIQKTFLQVAGYVHGQMPLVLHTQGAVLAECQDWSGAYKSFELAYEYQRQRVENVVANGSNDIRDTLAISLSNMAYCQYQQGNIMEALHLYESVLETDPPERVETVVRGNIEHVVGSETEHCASGSTTDSLCNVWQPLLAWASEFQKM